MTIFKHPWHLFVDTAIPLAAFALVACSMILKGVNQDLAIALSLALGLAYSVLMLFLRKEAAD